MFVKLVLSQIYNKYLLTTLSKNILRGDEDFKFYTISFWKNAFYKLATVFMLKPNQEKVQ